MVISDTRYANVFSWLLVPYANKSIRLQAWRYGTRTDASYTFRQWSGMALSFRWRTRATCGV